MLHTSESVVSFAMTCLALRLPIIEGQRPPINFLASLRPRRVLAAVQWVASASEPRSDSRDRPIREKFGYVASGETATRHLMRVAVMVRTVKLFRISRIQNAFRDHRTRILGN